MSAKQLKQEIERARRDWEQLNEMVIGLGRVIDAYHDGLLGDNRNRDWDTIRELRRARDAAYTMSEVRYHTLHNLENLLDRTRTPKQPTESDISAS